MGPAFLIFADCGTNLLRLGRHPALGELGRAEAARSRSIRLERLIASPLNCCAHMSCAVCEPGRSRIGGTEPPWSSISSVLSRSGCTMRASAGSSAEAVAVRNGAIGNGR